MASDLTDETGVVNLGAYRVRRLQDARAWSPVECLRQLIADIESGKVDPDLLLVLMHDAEPLLDGREWFPAIWAGGDITRALGLVTEAVGDGRLAAEEIDRTLMGVEYDPGPALTVILAEKMHMQHPAYRLRR